MREREEPRISLIRLYALVAEPRGLKPHELPLTERRELAARAAPLLWPGFQYNSRSQPREPEPVRVISYDPGWPESFEAWRERLAGILGPVACRIDHVGSTSVPGLAAKPVVDAARGRARGLTSLRRREAGRCQRVRWRPAPGPPPLPGRDGWEAGNPRTYRNPVSGGVFHAGHFRNLKGGRCGSPQ
jgi:hypothetical protein